MNAPVHFKQTGIEELILSNANEHDPQYTYDAWDDDELLLGSRFRNPSAGGALYHESNYTAGRWRFTAACASTTSTPACATAAPRRPATRQPTA